MKKIQKNISQKRRRTPAPLGLRAIFDVLQTDVYRSYHARTHAEEYSDVPEAIMDALNEDATRFVPVLFQTADREYPIGKHPHGGFGPDGDLRASEYPEVAVIPAFWAGVATAWYVLNAINGKGGAR